MHETHLTASRDWHCGHYFDGHSLYYARIFDRIFAHLLDTRVGRNQSGSSRIRFDVGDHALTGMQWWQPIGDLHTSVGWLANHLALRLRAFCWLRTVEHALWLLADIHASIGVAKGRRAVQPADRLVANCVALGTLLAPTATFGAMYFALGLLASHLAAELRQIHAVQSRTAGLALWLQALRLARLFTRRLVARVPALRHALLSVAFA